MPERVLMENAGRSVAQVIDRLFPRGRVVAAVGSGNNGGDALVVLRTLRTWGREVAYLPVGSREPDSGLFHGHPIPRVAAEDMPDAFSAADLLVDGILGTGTTGAPRGRAAEAIQAMNDTGLPIVALDLPSGIDPTTGQVPGAAVRAAVTVTFGWPKQGLLFFPARTFCGRIVAVEIGFPPSSEGQSPTGELITPSWAVARLPERLPNAYKGTTGRLLVVAGREGMAGAAMIAAHAALRAGAGYIRLASVAANRVVAQSLVPEAPFVDRNDEAAMRDAVADSDAVLIGPALGLDEGARRTLELVLDVGPKKPVLLDADALTLVSGDEALLRDAAGRQVILTPHVGEMRRLTGRPISDLLENPVEAARSFADQSGCVVVLKGAPSVVAAPGLPVLINTVGSSDLATAGMGDQLAGVTATFLAAGASARDAAGLGLFFAGRAADLAAKGRALGPRDVSEHLDRAFSDPGPMRPPLSLPFITFDQPARW